VFEPASLAMAAASRDTGTPAVRIQPDYALWMSALSLAGLARPLADDAKATEQATRAARAWLGVLDRGDHAASWERAAPLFRAALEPGRWDRAVRAVRAPLGRCRSRTLRSRQLVDSLSGGPRGPYAVIQFETAFETRADAVETVTPALGCDGRWRVAGYFIR